MNPPAGERSLKRLIGDVGASYRRLMLPPAGVLVLAVAACGIWLHQSREPLAAMAGSMFLLGGCVAQWPHRKRLTLPGWRTVGLLASLCGGLGGTAGLHALPQAILMLGGLAALVDMGAHVSRTLAAAKRLNRRLGEMDERDLLALLPEEARADARRWQAGDDGRSAELALVCHLSALWILLGRERARAPGRTHRIAAL